MSDEDISVNRRTVLERAAIGAAGGVFVASGSATAMVTSEELEGMKASQDCECTYEYKCEPGYCEQSPHFYTDYTQYSRECCTCNGETVCEDTWSESGCCIDA